jgi:hypothetical protein
MNLNVVKIHGSGKGLKSVAEDPGGGFAKDPPNLTGCFSDRHGCESRHPIGSKRGAGELFRVKNASNFRGHS